MLVAIEGIDGAGKNTLLQNLVKQAHSFGRKTAAITFPRYNSGGGASIITDFLNGEIDIKSPYALAAVFAEDRYAHKKEIEDGLNKADILFIDRYIASNAAYQAARLPTDEWRAFTEWVWDLEIVRHQLPCPDINIRLCIPRKQSHALIAQKKARIYTSSTFDKNEADENYLDIVADVYEKLSAWIFQDAWTSVDVVDDAGLRLPQTISTEAWREIEKQCLKR